MTHVRKSTLMKFVKRLEQEIPDLEDTSKSQNAYGMGLYYEGSIKTQQIIINRLKREFKLKEEKE